MPRKARTTITVDANEAMTETVSSNVETVSVSNKKNKHENEDMILCRSVTSGGLYFSGEKTKMLYSFADYGDEQEIEYQDLIYLIRSRDKVVYEPRIYILDNDIVEEHVELKRLYASMISTSDIREIINLPASQMRKTIEQLPSGMIEALKGQIATLIENHTLDSVTKIKALDEILGTSHLLMLAQK